MISGIGSNAGWSSVEGLGVTKDQLQSQADALGSKQGKRSPLPGLIESFEKADTSSDGKLSLEEIMAFEKAEHTHASESASGHFKVGLMRKLMQAAYAAPSTSAGASDPVQTPGTTSTLAVEA